MDRIVRARIWLSTRQATWIIVAVSLLLCAPAITAGFVGDDMIHAIALRDEVVLPGLVRAPWDAYAFAKDPATNARMLDEGLFAWWSDLDARYSFFRPLTSLSLWVDHHLWPEHPAWMHIHNLFWYALLLLAVAAVYRRFCSGAGAGFTGLALAAFALDDTRGMTAGWLANRASILALMFACGALLGHDRARTTGRTRWYVAALGSLAIGLLCGEAALQIMAYLLAYALFLDTDTRKQRLLSLVPYVTLVVLWRGAYNMLGYGAQRTDMYLDPATEPLRFAGALLERWSLLIASQFSGLSSDLGLMLHFAAPELEPFVLPVAIVCVALTVWVFAPLWNTRPDVRFWALGAALATIPVCAAMQTDRLLPATGLGGSALIAILLLAILDKAAALQRGPRRFFGYALAFVNLVVAPLLLPLQSLSIGYFANQIAYADRSLPKGEALAGKTLILLNPATDEYGLYLMLHRHLQGWTLPERFRWLATSENELTIARTDAATLTIRPGRGFVPPGSFGTLHSARKRDYVGETINLTGVRIRVTDITADARPAAIEVRFDAPLDGPQFMWMQFAADGGFVPFTPPALGQTLVVPAIDFRGLVGS